MQTVPTTTAEIIELCIHASQKVNTVLPSSAIAQGNDMAIAHRILKHDVEIVFEDGTDTAYKFQTVCLDYKR